MHERILKIIAKSVDTELEKNIITVTVINTKEV